MKMLVLYMVKPRESLRDRFSIDCDSSSIDSGVASLFLDTFVCSKWKVDRSSLDRLDHIVQVKLVYLAYLFSEFRGTHEYSTLFGDSNLSEGDFDTYWTVEEIDVDDNFDDLELHMSHGTMPRFKRSERNFINDWLLQLGVRVE